MKSFVLGTLTIAAAGIMASAPAHAADNVMKVCGAKYQAAKSAKTLPAGQTWNQYLAACRGTQPKTVAAAPAPATVTPAAKSIAATTAPAKPAAPSMTSKLGGFFHKSPAPAAAPVAAAPVAHPVAAPAPAAVAAKTPGTQSPAMAAVHDRQRQCGAQWKVDKAAGKTGTQTWPQYWSACNKRLKG